MPLSYKYCMVPKCKNTTIKTPDKLFFSVPMNSKMRRKWCKAMKRNTRVPLSCKSNKHCCEDHFDVEKDMENYMRFKMMGGHKILKKGVIPHKFACQKPPCVPVEKPAYAKRRLIEYFERVLSPHIGHENLTPEIEFVGCQITDSEDKIETDCNEVKYTVPVVEGSTNLNSVTEVTDSNNTIENNFNEFYKPDFHGIPERISQYEVTDSNNTMENYYSEVKYTVPDVLGIPDHKSECEVSDPNDTAQNNCNESKSTLPEVHMIHNCRSIGVQVNIRTKVRSKGTNTKIRQSKNK